ncbi:hypothetical protein D3C85_1322870 [compost metagenome]
MKVFGLHLCIFTILSAHIIFRIITVRVIWCPPIHMRGKQRALPFVAYNTPEIVTSDCRITFSYALNKNHGVKTIPVCICSKTVAIAWRIVSDHSAITRISKGICSCIYFTISIQVCIPDVSCSPGIAINSGLGRRSSRFFSTPKETDRLISPDLSHLLALIPGS